VTKDILPYALAIGNPARQTGWVSEYGHKLVFDEKNMAICPESKEKYLLKNNRISKI
jgi:UDP-2-acetamido-3-amino-2,3-dideoxy-glucuronate N-acetyltransferase